MLNDINNIFSIFIVTVYDFLIKIIFKNGIIILIYIKKYQDLIISSYHLLEI